MFTKRLLIMLMAVVCLLLIPFVSMLFTDEVNWTRFDFIAAAVLLLGTALLAEFFMQKIKSLRYRVIICLVLIALLLIIWLELAVGIFGSPLSGQ